MAAINDLPVADLQFGGGSVRIEQENQQGILARAGEGLFEWLIRSDYDDVSDLQPAKLPGRGLRTLYKCAVHLKVPIVVRLIESPRAG